MGIDLTASVTMFITKMVKEHVIPFTPTSLPVETLQSLKEAKHPELLKNIILLMTSGMAEMSSLFPTLTFKRDIKRLSKKYWPIADR